MRTSLVSGLLVVLLSILFIYKPVLTAVEVGECQQLLEQNGSMQQAQFKFELIYNALKDNHNKYTNVVWSSFGFLLMQP